MTILQICLLQNKDIFEQKSQKVLFGNSPMKREMEQRFFDAYEAYADAIFRHCYFRVSDRELARDIMQESFMRTWEYMASGKDPENIRAFLYRVASNLIIDHYRKKKAYSLDALSENHGFDPSSDETDRIIDASDAKRALMHLPRLPEPYRTVFVMRYVDGFTPREIAETTGEHENTISVRIHRAAKKLRSYIEEQII